MSFKDIRDQKIPEDQVGSRAECLAAMDCLMHHMSDEDEDEIACWLQDGIPDSGFWPVLETEEVMGDRRDYYTDLVRGMTYGDYEACVMIFANAVKAQCFKTKYQPRSLT